MTQSDVAPGVQIVEWSEIEEKFAGPGEAGGGGALLLGNGFSTNIWSAFGYRSLLERSMLTGEARDLFGGRFNFETVLAELSIARNVLSVADPINHSLLDHLDDLAKEVRRGLLETVGQVHPDANQLLARQAPSGGSRFVGAPVQVLDKVASHLQRYSRVFMTNYDLIAYWAKVQADMADLFHGADPFDERQAEEWLYWPQPKVFFLHGALHLWRSLTSNAEGKHTASTETLLLDVIRSSVDQPGLVPLFISEGSSEEKIARISASPYLSFCNRALSETDATLTVLGQALGEVDQHVCDAIECNPHRAVAIGVWVGDVDEQARQRTLQVRSTQLRGRLPNCHDVVFFDSTEHPLTSQKLHCR